MKTSNMLLSAFCLMTAAAISGCTGENGLASPPAVQTPATATPSPTGPIASTTPATPPKVASTPIERLPQKAPTGPIPATLHPALFLVGDSIMNTGTGTGATGPWGYGAELIPMFDSTKIHVYNEGKGGRSARGYIEEGAWANVLARMAPGDWVLVQFGHNDAANSTNYPDRIEGKGSGDELSEVDAPGGKKNVHSYGWYLKQYAMDAKDKGASLIILSPVPRNQWTNGKIKRGFDGYVQWAAEAAKSSGTTYFDLNAIAADRYDALGQQATARLFADNQHTTKGGAHVNAESVVAGLRSLKDCALASDLLPTAATNP